MKVSWIKKLLLLVMIIAIIARISIDITKVANPEWFQMLFNIVFWGSMILIVYTPIKTFKNLILALFLSYATIILPLITTVIRNRALNIKITILSLAFILLYFALSFVYKDLSTQRKNKKI